MLVGELEDDGVGGDLVAGEGVLGNHAVLVFDLHRDGFVGEVSLRLVEDGGHFAGFDAVVVVLADPNLELAGERLAERSAAVEEGLLHAADFGDVEGDRDRRAIGKLDAEVAVGVLAEQGFEFGEVHGVALDLRRVASCLGPGQQEFSRRQRRLAALAGSSG